MKRASPWLKIEIGKRDLRWLTRHPANSLELLAVNGTVRFALEGDDAEGRSGEREVRVDGAVLAILLDNLLTFAEGINHARNHKVSDFSVEGTMLALRLKVTGDVIFLALSDESSDSAKYVGEGSVPRDDFVEAIVSAVEAYADRMVSVVPGIRLHPQVRALITRARRLQDERARKPRLD